jgi:hypothetical protein
LHDENSLVSATDPNKLKKGLHTAVTRLYNVLIIEMGYETPFS